MATELHERTDIHINDLAGDRLKALAAKAPLFAAGGGVLALIGLGLAVSQGQSIIFFESYLMAFMFWFGITLGSMAWLMGHHVTGGGWGFMLRRPLEGAIRNWPVVVVMWLPIFVAMLISHSNGHAGLYSWADPKIVAIDDVLQKKIGWLNVVGWSIRAVIYFAIWMTISHFLLKLSKREDTTDDPWVRHRLTQMSAGCLVVFAFTITFAVIDWVMSIEPHWYSSLFGFIFIVGQGHSTLCIMFILIRYLAGDTPLVKSIERRYFRDVGNLLLAFTLLWAYTNYSQFMIQYSGNVEEDAFWFVHRTTNGWEWFGFTNIILHFALPFIFLLMSLTKVNMKNLAKLAMFLVVARHVDLTYYIMPTFRLSGPFTSAPASLFTDLGCPIFLGGIWLMFWARNMYTVNAPVVPQFDARLDGHWPLAVDSNGNGHGNAHGLKEAPAHV